MSDLAEANRQRLGHQAKCVGVDTQRLLTHWAIERFLNRMSRSEYAPDFVMRGPSLFTVWHGAAQRAFSDLDLEFTNIDLQADAVDIIMEVARSQPDRPDGLIFAVEQARILRLARDGVRVILPFRLGTTHQVVKVNVCFGNPITPGLEHRWYPTLLHAYEPTPVSCFPKETIVAEILARAVEFGANNSRLADYFDLSILIGRYALQGHQVAEAVTATFACREAGSLLFERLDGRWQEGFLPVYVTPARERAWRWWVAIHAPHEQSLSFAEVVTQLQRFSVPLLECVRKGRKNLGRWEFSKGWSKLATRAAIPRHYKGQTMRTGHFGQGRGPEGKHGTVRSCRSRTKSFCGSEQLRPSMHTIHPTIT
jgi:hypothetical protein